MTAAPGPGGGVEDGLDCILGRCDSLRAEVFFRAARPPGGGGDLLTGTLSGPACRRAATLPVTSRLAPVDAGPGAPVGTVVARTILTEPSFWTPELPHLYDLEARLLTGGREEVAWRRAVGLRRLGVRGRSLWLDGRRFVPRGLVRAAADIEPGRFREAGVAAVVSDPPGPLLEACDAEGVPVIAVLADATDRPLDGPEALARIVRWTWHAAVLMAVVPRGASTTMAAELAAAVRPRRGTLLLAREVDGSLPPPAVPPGVDALVVTLPAAGLPDDAWRTGGPDVPLLARRVGDPAAAAAPPSRRACDSLQAELASWSVGAAGPCRDWAGYVAG